MGHVEVSVVDNVAVVRLSRPERLNALSLDMWRSLRDVFSRYCRGGVEGVVVTGSGRAFSSGDDIVEMYSLETPERATEFFETLGSVLEEIALCEAPVVAAVNGLAVGGGGEIVLLADYVVASRDSWFSYPEMWLGLIPPVLLTIGTEALGLRRARRLALTGERIDATRALEIGLVDEVVEGERVVERAVEVAREIYRRTTREALKRARALVYKRFSEGLREAIETLRDLATTREARERMRSFIEKRSRPPTTHV